MSFLINNVQCDAFAHIDANIASSTIGFSLSSRAGHSLTAFLYCDGKEFPISKTLTAECCIKGLSQKQTISCVIGNSGEIIFTIPSAFLNENEYLSCEINISGTDKEGVGFRYKASNFFVAIIA